MGDKMLQYGQKLEYFLNHHGGHVKAVDRFVNRHIDPVMLYLSFKIIVDEYYEAVGICEKVTDAIHYRTYKDLIPVYDMSYAFNCPNTPEGFLNACKAITYVVELVQQRAHEGEILLVLLTFHSMQDIAKLVGRPAGCPKHSCGHHN